MVMIMTFSAARYFSPCSEENCAQASSRTFAHLCSSDSSDLSGAAGVTQDPMFFASSIQEAQ